MATLSIRSYSRQTKGHSHKYNQLVLPLFGVINIEVGSFNGKVRPGECVIVKAEEVHYFAAEEQAKFVVADLATLPDALVTTENIVFSITPPLLHFLSFIEQQLKHQVNPQIETLMDETFYALLSEQETYQHVDQRIRKAQEFIEGNLAQSHSINELAALAFLSPTQFKKLFKQQTGQTITEYITRLRMEKAQALLIHTDSPIQIVAEIVGYSDHSAFSRRFTQHFGLPPSKVRR